MEFYDVLLPLALILFLSKILGIFCKKIGIPQVVSMLLAGLILGLLNKIPNFSLFGESGLEGLNFIAKIGVVLIMFSAGLETDLKQIKATGVAAIVITILGVIIPLGLGFVVATLFNGGFANMSKEQMMSNLFYGTILTATSVSVTVATLKELGKLQSKVGTSIISAAILDDIIGVILLSFVIGMSNSSTSSSENPWKVIVMTILFFVFIFICGIIIRKIFAYLDKKEHHHRRIPIFGLVICFLFAYLAEKVFGVADITGAFFAGLILSSNKERNYIDRRSEIVSYLIFTPVFFANIGMTTDFSALNASMIGFGSCFVIAGLLGKLIGCGVGALICKFTMKESVRVGLGMMARAEVCLICAQKGIDSGLVDSAIMPFILIMIILTSFITPLLLKLTYKGEKELIALPDQSTPMAQSQ